MWTQVTLLLSLYTAGIYGANCPDGFEGHQGSCYFFSHGEETWIGAFETCKELLGSYLVEVNSIAENDYLSKKNVVSGAHSYWIGLTDKLIEGEFVWETSKNPVGGLTFWGTDEPDADPGDNCVRYSTSHQNLWSDSDCGTTYRYVCEKGDGDGVIIG